MAEKQYPFSKMRLRFRSLMLIGILATTSAMAAPESATTAKLEIFGEAFTNITKAPKTQARVYAYRTSESASGLPINVYLNGHYHASLLRGGYTEFCLNPGKVSMQTALDDASQMHMGKLQMGTALNAQAGQPIYVRVQDSVMRPVSLQAVTEQQATTDLRRTRRQIHTISRAPEVQECSTDLMVDVPVVQAPPPPPPKPVPQREYALETDALFEFGKAELKAVGFNAIETLVQQVRQDYTQFERIRVIGYTDAIGPVNLNKRLSQQRADAVARHLSIKGLRPTQGIQAEGRWSLELAKTNCKNTPTPENKACHAPNRRVVIVVYGLRR